MDSAKPKRTRPPPRLRTKTGCLKCRERRKKCDERRPVCSACERLHIECVYRRPSISSAASPQSTRSSLRSQSPEAVVKSPTTTTAVAPLQRTSLWVRPEGIKTARDWNIFQYCSTTYVQLLTTPDATSEFRDVSFVLSAGFDVPWVMHAALAPAALHASHAALIPKEDAMVYTQSALQGLRQAAQNSRSQPASKESFLAASLFLGIFEDFYSSPSSHSLTHYRAIASVLEEQAADVPRFEISRLSVFHRTLLDSVLYHFSTRLIFEKDIDAICSAFPNQTVAKYIEALDTDRMEGKQHASILPVLGKTPPALFLLIYQITWLSRQLPFNSGHNYTLALRCLTELDLLQETCSIFSPEHHGMAQTTTKTRTSDSAVAGKLYFLAARIFIAKVLDPDRVSSASPEIKALLMEALELLKVYDGSAPCGQFICWPILILGCAACPMTMSEAGLTISDAPDENLRLEMRKLIQSQLLQIWKVSYSGYVRRTAGALEKIWKLPTMLVQPSLGSISGELEVEYDGLNALISKNGVGTALQCTTIARKSDYS
ncbi:hypothetical protein HRR83_007465 [Exophiala dermatitidis]|uniref:Zn(2)-C6 fungal-type domain-containing protein n=2 Tax=Exophiala dermatitidis TaxID=5970 RepID=H6C2G3_EXODN|nr:uncharacterized protein HMPREF1120_06744 [Exophiala dermatitidis NIH/UT8656]KAJ4508523.1 hypothetical protein HRR75_006344 [Exophiala dermatitidis]EHY58741.1 hypothetical protein HMPREF1120_06744 [Exophiala dermatitidis NIH/UT8656]KAJ4510439.1 hypothetical protein HRR74_006911 [Exophiala dermatitidis]KAJ4510627.1 hypothetical protein HRR73_006699 [Exophiala dermatitidis]KAJ4535047.1 hypothetical protein HRR76_006949 [Exophiala dermatitidis]